MTQARIELCCSAISVNIGSCFDKEIYPGTIIGTNKALYLYKDPFCLKWKTDIVSFNKTIEELESYFKKVHNYKMDEKFHSYFRYE